MYIVECVTLGVVLEGLRGRIVHRDTGSGNLVTASSERQFYFAHCVPCVFLLNIWKRSSFSGIEPEWLASANRLMGR